MCSVENHAATTVNAKRQKANSCAGRCCGRRLGQQMQAERPQNKLCHRLYTDAQQRCVQCAQRPVDRQAGQQQKGIRDRGCPEKRPKRCRPEKMYRRGAGTRRSGCGPCAFPPQGVRAFSQSSNAPCTPPHTTKCNAAPCQRPLNRNTTMVFTASRAVPRREPPSGI